MNRLNELTNLVYQGALDGEWSPFLLKFMDLTGSNSGWLAMLNTESNTPVFSKFLSNATDFDHTSFLERYLPNLDKDPNYVHSRHFKEGDSWIGSTLVSRDLFRNDPMYPLFVEGGVEWSLISVPVQNRFFTSFAALNRDKSKLDYSESDMQLMQMIVPHMNRAIDLHNKLLSHQKQLSLYQSILERNPYPLIVIDEKQNLLQSNPMAEHVLKGQTILVERNGKLTSNLPTNEVLLKNFIRSTLAWIQANTPEPTSIRLTKGDEQLILKAYPIHAANDFNNYQNPCCVIEILSTKQPDWQIFSEQFTITPKELRTIKLLYEGFDLEQVAEQSNVSFNTVKTQLMSVYRKTGYSSQRELVAQVVKYI